MKSKGITPWIVAVVVLLVVGVGFYYYFSVQSITEYYLIKYTPPLPETDVWGYSKMTDPEVEVKEVVSTFASDSAAVAKCKEEKELVNSIWNEKTLPRLLDEADNEPNARARELKWAGTMAAYRSAMAQQWTLIRISHTPSFDPKEVLEQLPDIWQDRDKVEALREKYKIDIALYPIL